MYVGVTGGIGSGKSEFARLLSELGAYVIDADQLARDALADGSPAVAQVADAFPSCVVGNHVDRAALASAVFGNAAALRRLEDIVHPEVARLAAQARSSAPAGAVVVYDVPLLTEKGMERQFDAVVVVTAPMESRLARLAARGLSRADALARIESQATDDERAAVADLLVDNSGTLEDLRQQARRVMASLTA